MNESLQSIFAALGNTLLNSIWQTGVLWLLVLLYSKIHPTVSPARLSSMSFIALLTSFLLFIGTLIISILQPTSTGIGILQQLLGAKLLYQIVSYSAILYLLLLIVPIARLLIGIIKVQQLKNKGIGRIPGQLKIFVLDVCQHLDIKKKVQCFTSSIIQSPLTIGFLKPIVLLPLALANQLTMQQMEMILLHELAHIKRNDYLQNMISQIILSILYFNPFAKMLGNLENLEREKSADGWVMQFSYSRHMYSTTLFQLAQSSNSATPQLAIPMIQNGFSLLQRVEYLMGVGKLKYPSLKLLLFSFTAILLTLTLLSHPESSKQKPIVSQSMVYAPLTHTSFASALFDTLPSQSFTIANISNDPIIPSPTPYSIAEILVQPTTAPSNTIEQITENIEAPMLTPTYATATIFTIPTLSDQEEKNIQELIAMAKTIIIERNWQAITQSLAETVTDDFKQNLKNIYTEKVNNANWENQINMLRTEYNNINWKVVENTIVALATTTHIDSVLYKQFIAVSIDSVVSNSKNVYREATLRNNTSNQRKFHCTTKDSLNLKKVVAL